jgi:O-antigen ligase
MLAGPSIRDRFSTVFVRGKDVQADNSADSRILLWGIARQLSFENPIFGIGPGNFLVLSTKWVNKPRVPHSLWYQTAAETGLVGLGLLVLMYISACWQAWRLFRHPPPGEWIFREMGRMVLLSLPGFFVSATFLSIIYLEQPYYVVLFMIGACKVAEPLYSASLTRVGFRPTSLGPRDWRANQGHPSSLLSSGAVHSEAT